MVIYNKPGNIVKNISAAATFFEHQDKSPEWNKIQISPNQDKTRIFLYLKKSLSIIWPLLIEITPLPPPPPFLTVATPQDSTADTQTDSLADDIYKRAH